MVQTAVHLTGFGIPQPARRGGIDIEHAVRGSGGFCRQGQNVLYVGDDPFEQLLLTNASRQLMRTRRSRPGLSSLASEKATGMDISVL